ncbi:MAG: hypothetical protein ABJF10_30170, partial [Chthoniobacter sp.]
MSSPALCGRSAGSFEAHALWMEPGIDLYCVATEESKARLAARGAPEKIMTVTGIPVSQRFLH